MKINVGDEILRFFEPLTLFPATMYHGKVVKIEDNVVTCKVDVDVQRTMKFDKRNGKALLQDGFGTEDFILPKSLVLDFCTRPPNNQNAGDGTDSAPDDKIKTRT